MLIDLLTHQGDPLPHLAEAVLSGNKDALDYQRTNYAALPLFKEA